MAGMMSSDAIIYFFDCLPGVTSLCIEQKKFVGDSFYAGKLSFRTFDTPTSSENEEGGFARG
jgi:hypothetical protein